MNYIKSKKISYIGWLYLILFSVTPFLLSVSDIDKANLVHMNKLPTFISIISSYVRWIVFGLVTLFAVVKFKELLYRINNIFLFLFFFYFMQLVYAVISNTDILRYFSLSVLVISLPFSAYYAIKENGIKILLYSKYIVSFCVIISILLNISMVAEGFRFQGFLNNSNLYGFTAVFWVVILLLSASQNNIFFNFIIVVTVITILLSGSRNAMLCCVIVMLFHFGGNIKRLIFPLILFLSLLFITTLYIDIPDFIIKRLFNVFDAVSDSGRYEIWERAFYYIERNLFWGNGMYANELLVDTGNMHNCYIRYLLNMGLVFFFISFSFYVFYIIKIILNIKTTDRVLIGFIIAYTFANIGEDFFVGVGSSVFIYFCIIVGFITFDLTNKKRTK